MFNPLCTSVIRTSQAKLNIDCVFAVGINVETFPVCGLVVGLVAVS